MLTNNNSDDGDDHDGDGDCNGDGTVGGSARRGLWDGRVLAGRGPGRSWCRHGCRHLLPFVPGHEAPGPGGQAQAQAEAGWEEVLELRAALMGVGIRGRLNDPALIVAAGIAGAVPDRIE